MATDPNTLLPTPQDAAMAQQAQLAAMQERGREAIRAYLLENKGRATLEGAQSIGAQFGLNIPQGAQAAIDWANREGTDVNLIPITTDVLAEPGAASSVILESPEPPPPESDRGILEAAAAGAADVFAREPSLGLDPENRQALSQLGPIGRVLLTPLGDIGAGAITAIQAGLEGGALGAGQLMENVGLLDVIESATGVQQSPESARNELMAILESEGLRAPMGYATPRPTPVAPIQQIARAPELPEAPVTPIQRIAQVAPAPQVSAQPSGSLFRGQPEQFTDLQIVANTNAIDNILVGRGIFTTSDRDLAATYGPNIFEFERPNLSKVFDISNPSEKDLRKLFPERGFEDTFALIKSAADRGDTRTAEDIVFEVLAQKHLPEDVNWEEVKNGFTFERGINPDAIRDLVSKDIQDAGFDFLKHQGGIRAGGGDKLHEVFIALRDEALVPKTQSAASAASEVLTPIQRIAQAPETPPGVPRATMTAPQRAEALETLEQKGQTQPVMELGLSRKAANFAADYLNEAGLTRPQDVPFTQFFYDHFTAGTLPDETVQRLFKQYDMSPVDVVEAATGLRASASELGRGLGLLSQVSRLVPTEAAEIARLGARTQPDPSLWVRAGNAMRGLLVSQVATTMRNVVGTAARAAPVGLDPFVRTVDNIVNASLNPVRKLRGEEAVPVNPLDAWVLTTQQFRPKQNDAIFRQLRNAQPKINKKLLSAYSPDVTRPVLNDKFGKIEKAVDTLNIFNRASEYVTRRAAFPAFLRREAERKGLDFDTLVENNQLHTIPSDIMERALNETLDLVYARRPSEGGPLFLGKTSQKIVDFVEDMGPIGASVVGFPNFIANALRFQFEHSPAGFLRLLSKNERNRLMKGDSDVLGKAVAGSAMLYTAMQFQDSEYAGSKWYNMRLPDGREIDLRPFFPAAPYLLMADLQKRYEDGTLDVAYTAADIVQGFSGAQFRAGGGLYAVDQLMRDIVQAGSVGEGAMAAVKGILGNAVGGVLTPFSTLKDVVGQFRPEETVVRDVSEAPFLGAALRNVPFAQSELLGLPEQQYVSQEAPRTTDEPLLRQLTGAAIRPAPTIIQDEMRDLGFEDYDLYKKEGFPALDRRAKEIIGSIAEYNADAYFGSEAYQAADSLTKREMFKEFYKGIRAIARDAIKEENPAYAALMFFQDQSREDKIRLNNEYSSATGKDFKAFFSQLAEAPLVQTQEEFDALPVGAEYTDPGDYKVYTKK